MTTDDTCRQVPAGDLTSPNPARKCAHPKLWAAIAAAEIEALGRPGAAIVDAVYEHRLGQIGGPAAVERYGRIIARVDEDYVARAWLLGEVETLGELDEHGGGMSDEVASWVADVRAFYQADRERLVAEIDDQKAEAAAHARAACDLRALLRQRDHEVADLRARVAQAGQQVLDLLAREARARAQLEDLVRRLSALTQGGHRDALNTEPDEVQP